MTFFRSSIIALALVSLFACADQNDDTSLKLPQEQRIKEALEEDFQRTYDPALGYPPKERLYEAYIQTRAMQKKAEQGRSADDLLPKFDERGPVDIGGRTRTMLVDSRDSDGKKVWAGSVAGGLFVTEDITAAQPIWRKADDFLENLSISAIVQDFDDPNIMYMGTGEGYVNGDAVRGLGIFKSTDGGISWTLLESTRTTIFAYTRGMAIQPGTGYVYAATRTGGVRRSEDGGETWVKVLGINLAAGDDSMYDVMAADGKMYASNTTNVFMSEDGARGNWIHISRSGSGFPTNLNRTEIAPCPNDGNIIYALGAIGSTGSPVYKTTDGGDTWVDLGLPGSGGNYAGSQAWYDLDLAVDPYNCNRAIAAGIDLRMTSTGGSSWNNLPHSSYSTSVGHVDQHKVYFDPYHQGTVYFGNDGGVWRSTDGSAQIIEDKNFSYITTQYYGCAIHPDTFSNYMLGGTQDNGTHQINESGPASGRNVWGGDGFLCHIDQNDPDYQMVSSQFGRWGLSRNGGLTFSQGENTNSGFLTPSDYDSDDGILYTQTNDGSFYRWNVKSGLFELVDWTGVPSGGVRTIAVDPNTPHRVYFGTGSGRIVRIDSAHVGSTVEAELVYQNFNRTISSIAFGNGSSDDIIATISNYGVNSVIVSNDGGETWTECEGNLPDMPVRWGIFSPKDPSEALIATEMGVWSTSLLNGNATVWNPPVSGKGTPIVRTDQLDWRESDHIVIAGTHGRGLWTSSVFSEPRAKFVAPQVHYEDSPLRFIGEVSLNAQSYAWTFGDGSSSTEENPIHSYSEIGEYDVELTINGELSTASRVKILPRAALPYTEEAAEYGGSFEGFDEQVGTEIFNGSSFEVGVSEFVGKSGTKSGASAMVLSPDEPFYDKNTNASFYLPRFDFSDTSIYGISFYANHFLQGNDGFIVEYTTDAGQSWNILGKQTSTWYNFNSNQLENSAWPNNTPYFTKEVGAFKRYSMDISFLSGETDVAFKFQFRSDNQGLHPGVAIDDIEITKYEGELLTKVTEFTGEFSDGNKEITLKWKTIPEYYCSKFEIERSFNGRDFEKIKEVPATGVLTANLSSYQTKDSQGGEIFFYRIKVINEDDDAGYYHEFYTPTITVRRLSIEPGMVYRSGSGPRIFPNPFSQTINVTFTSNLQQDVIFELYDATGRLVLEQEQFIEDVFIALDVVDMPVGVYYLAIQIGDAKREVYPLTKG